MFNEVKNRNDSELNKKEKAVKHELALLVASKSATIN